MLFRKKIEPACVYCGKGTELGDGEVLCKRHGVVNLWDSCRFFKYNPYLRIPEREPALKQVVIASDDSEIT